MSVKAMVRGSELRHSGGRHTERQALSRRRGALSRRDPNAWLPAVVHVVRVVRVVAWCDAVGGGRHVTHHHHVQSAHTIDVSIDKIQHDTSTGSLNSLLYLP